MCASLSPRRRAGGRRAGRARYGPMACVETPAGGGSGDVPAGWDHRGRLPDAVRHGDVGLPGVRGLSDVARHTGRYYLGFTPEQIVLLPRNEYNRPDIEAYLAAWSHRAAAARQPLCGAGCSQRRRKNAASRRAAAERRRRRTGRSVGVAVGQSDHDADRRARIRGQRSIIPATHGRSCSACPHRRGGARKFPLMRRTLKRSGYDQKSPLRGLNEPL